MIHKMFVYDRAFYFSYTLDLTHTLQTQKKNVDVHSMWKFANEVFFWNHHISKPLIQSNMNGYVLPMIRGHVEITRTSINNRVFTFGVISRTGCKRAGTRFNCRGADTSGNVANFVETEQFIDCKEYYKIQLISFR